MKKTNIIILVSVAVILFISIVSAVLFFVFKDKNDSDKTAALNSSEDQSYSSDNSKTIIERPEKITEVFSFKSEFSTPVFKSKTFYDSQNGNTLPYRLYIPDDYDSSKRYPVILFLHGAGEIGTDNEKHIKNAMKMFENNADLVSQSIIVCPQTNEWWNLDREAYGDQKGTLGSVLHLLTQIKKTYSCDNNRIYVTGLSMGGYATWNLLQNYGNLFAAGMPICGGGDSSKGYELMAIPIRIYHSKDDPTVSFSASKRMYDAIINAGGKKVEFVQLDGLGHDSWSYAYSDREAFSWMFSQDKAKNKTGKYERVPYFSVVDANGNIVISENDILLASSRVSLDENDSTTVELILNANGESKLKKAYEENLSEEFTVYWYQQRLCTFTVSGPPIDKIFSLTGVFDKEKAKNFCYLIGKVIP